MQPDDYDRFKPFFSKALAKYHKVPEDAKHENNWDFMEVKELPPNGKLDLTELGLTEPLSMRVRVGRNLKEFALPGAMQKEDRIKFEQTMLGAFDKLKKTPGYGGNVYSLTPHADWKKVTGQDRNPNWITDAKYDELVKAHVMFKDMAADSYLASAGIASHWPCGRGCYQSEDEQFIIWFGEEDHLRIMCMKKGTVLNEVFKRLKRALDLVNGIEGMEFAQSPQYGYVTSCPTNLGTGMRASLHIKLPKLTADGQKDAHGNSPNCKNIAKPLGLSVRGLGGEHTPIGADGTVDISPSARFCITEAQIITALYLGIKQMADAEAKMQDAVSTTNHHDTKQTNNHARA
jgi:creatine kinase